MAKPNPLYGTGIFRRRIHLRADNNAVAVELEDGNHGFRIVLRHDGEQVSGIDMDALRHPFNTCPEALGPLQRIVGHRLDSAAQTLRDRLVPGDNCTHLFDMAALAVSHAGCSGTELDYDMAVEDEVTGDETARAARVEISCNGRSVHAWQVRAHHIVAPPALAGLPMMRGFHAWASRHFNASELEAAIALQRAYFVAQSRRHSFDPPAANPAIGDGMPQGSCYSYNHGAVERAVRSTNTVRDFTNTPEKLLRFEPSILNPERGSPT